MMCFNVRALFKLLYGVGKDRLSRGAKKVRLTVANRFWRYDSGIRKALCREQLQNSNELYT